MEEPRFVVITDEDFKKKVQIKAINAGKSVSEIILTLLKDWLKNGKK